MNKSGVSSIRIVKLDIKNRDKMKLLNSRHNLLLGIPDELLVIIFNDAGWYPGIVVCKHIWKIYKDRVRQKNIGKIAEICKQPGTGPDIDIFFHQSVMEYKKIYIDPSIDDTVQIPVLVNVPDMNRIIYNDSQLQTIDWILRRPGVRITNITAIIINLMHSDNVDLLFIVLRRAPGSSFLLNIFYSPSKMILNGKIFTFIQHPISRRKNVLLEIACQQNDLVGIKKLLNLGADPDDQNYRAIFCVCAWRPPVVIDDCIPTYLISDLEPDDKKRFVIKQHLRIIYLLMPVIAPRSQDMCNMLANHSTIFRPL